MTSTWARVPAGSRSPSPAVSGDSSSIPGTSHSRLPERPERRREYLDAWQRPALDERRTMSATPVLDRIPLRSARLSEPEVRLRPSAPATFRSSSRVTHVGSGRPAAAPGPAPAGRRTGAARYDRAATGHANRGAARRWPETAAIPCASTAPARSCTRRPAAGCGR